MAMDIFDWVMEKIMPLFLIVIFFGLFIFIGCIVYDAAFNKHPSYTLYESEWTCTKSHQTVTMIPVQVGKTTILQPIPTTICDEYTRNH